MHIKTLIIEGFKSYGHRTVIDGFDPEFNAITGLNGSGKSNILDSICFVLGITNLTHVRAANSEDLIFKSGQANITKATVTVVFDNRNPEQAPVGYERMHEITISRQIMIGGKNKYMINGATVPNKKVQDLLCSVQLNVNNPNFLIMQGKITKVLSMKPTDILAMIEESAGTKMYEVKKLNAQKTIEKKNAKLEELNGVLRDEIKPRMEKYRTERAKYAEFKRIESDLELMLQLYQGWQYLQIKQHLRQAEETLEENQSQLAEWQGQISNNVQEIETIEEQVGEITAKTNAEGKEKIAAIEAEMKSASTQQALNQAKIKSIKDNINVENKKKAQLEKNVKDDSTILAKKTNDLNKVKSFFENLKETERANNEAVENCEKRYQALVAGKELNDEGEAETLQEQLMHATEKAASAASEIKQSELKLRTYRTQLGEKTKKRQSQVGEVNRLQADYNSACESLKKTEAKIANLGYNDAKINEMKQRRNVLLQEMQSVENRVGNFRSQRPHTMFQYKDPEPNFNRKKVIGVVCRLIQIKSEQAYMAIETAAGGRLYNVIVDTEETCKKLLQKGELQLRTTFIPLNKIKASTINEATVKYAQDLVGRDNCKSALDYLIYDKRTQVVMEYIFGNVLICKDLNVAKQVAFHPRIKKRCVTLDGDVVDPAGTLSGGAAAPSGSVFKQLMEIKKYEDELEVKQREMSDLQSELERLAAQQNEFARLQQELTMAQCEANMLKQSLEQTSGFMEQKEMEELQKQIGELEERVKQCQVDEKQFGAKVKELEQRIKSTTTNDLIQATENELKALKIRAQKSQEEWQKKENEYEVYKLEIAEVEKSIANTKLEIEAVDKLIEELNEKVGEAEENSTEINKQVEEIQSRLDAEKEKIAGKNSEIKKKKQRQDELKKEISEIELKIKEHNHRLNEVQANYKLILAKEKDVEKKTSARNIENAEKLSANEGNSLENRIRAMQEQKKKLERTVNVKAQNMFEQQEQEFKEISKKVSIVESDKKDLLQIIKDMDSKKEEILTKSYHQISKDFGSIFSTLLPGANAKLVAPYGQSLLKGLEIKVSLSNVWKENLTELSGGQRSLAALSLILAMLRFKPAPLYILDEIDAALDLSHTENIGTMLKSHFKQSQFIIVSLKDGMFKNANVLYRTQFVDGLSSVNRTVNRTQ